MSELADIKKEEKAHVTWTVFIWAIGLLLAGIGWAINISVKASDVASNTITRVSAVEGDIKSINTNITWIKDTLEKRQTIR